jgi:histidinol-phosphate aminotransferase
MTFIDQWLRSDIRNINAYHVPSAKNMLKMDAMESPFGVPEELKDEFLEYISKSEVNRYPDASADELQATLRGLMEIPEDCELLLGNGSDELIQLLSLACRSGDLIMSFEPSFVMYELVSKFAQLNYHGIPLDQNFDIDLNSSLLAIKNKKPKLIFIAYPNNPTGNSFDYEAIIEIIKSTDALVVLDEAYYAYSERSFLTEIVNFSNLVVLRTISKIGFAGLRLGLLVGSQSTIEQLNKLRLPYNINTLTQASGNFLLKDKKRISNNAKIIMSERERLYDELSLIPELTVYPSQTNFLLIEDENAKLLFESLRDSGVLVKAFAIGSQLENFIRISVGEAKENNIFLGLIRDYYDRS